MNGESTGGQRDLMRVGQYQVIFNEAGADIEHMSTLARYRVQAATATNAVIKEHWTLDQGVLRARTSPARET